MNDNSLIDKVNQSTDIVKLVSEFISLEKRGKNYMGLCPFHEEKTPSFSVSPELNIGLCMGCKEGGAPITFYSKIKNISFRDALYDLAKRAGLESQLGEKKVDKHENDYLLMEAASAFYHYNLLNSESGKEVLEYLKMRNVSFDAIKHFEIGLAPKYGDTIYKLLKEQGFNTTKMINLGLVKHSDTGDYYDLFSNRLMFPIKNEFGRTIAFSGRTLDKNDHVKYVNSPQTQIFNKSEVLYNFNEAKKSLINNRPLIISEGFFDTIKIYQSGFNNVVATMGTALTSKHISNIKRTTNNVITAFDGDSAGLEASSVASKLFLKNGIIPKIIPLSKKMDPDDYIDEYGEDAFVNLVENKLIDAYAFLYKSLKGKYDLKIISQVPKFRKDALSLINTYDISIKDQFLKILAKDLKIDQSELSLPKESSKLVEHSKTLLENKKEQKLINKHEKSEDDLIGAMINSRTLAYFISERLDDEDYIKIFVPLLRKKIMRYYETNEIFQINAPDLGLDQNELDYIAKIHSNFVFSERLFPNEENVLTLIKYLKKSKLVRKLEALLIKIDNYKNDSELIKLSMKRDDLFKEINDI